MRILWRKFRHWVGMQQLRPRLASVGISMVATLARQNEIPMSALTEAAERERMIRVLMRFIPSEYHWMLAELQRPLETSKPVADVPEPFWTTRELNQLRAFDGER